MLAVDFIQRDGRNEAGATRSDGPGRRRPDGSLPRARPAHAERDCALRGRLPRVASEVSKRASGRKRAAGAG